MPTIPLPTTQTVFSTGPAQPYQHIDASPADFGGLEGRAMEGLGQSLGQAGAQTTQTVLQNQQYINEADSNHAQNQFLSTVNDLLNGNAQKGITGFRSLQGKQAVDAYPQYQQKLQDAFDSIKATLNPAAQREFDFMGSRMLRGTMDSMGSFQASQARVYGQDEARAKVALSQQAAIGNADDPAAFSHFLNETQDASLQASQLAGLGPEATEANRLQDLSKVYVNRVQQLAARDPISAAKFYHDNINAVMPAQRFQLERMLDTATKTQYAATDGIAAYHAAIGQTTDNSPLPANKGADFVKPFDQQQISSIKQQVTAPSQYDAIFNKVAQQYGLNPVELKMRAAVESGMKPDAVSPQGAVGLMQIMPATAKQLGIDPRDPEQAIQGAARLMVQAGGSVAGGNEAVDRAYYGGSTDAQGKNTDQYVENMRAVRQAIMGPQAVAPMTVPDLEARQGDVLAQARAAAEQRRPGDAAYADQVVAEAQKNFSRDLQALRGQEYANTSKVLDAVVKGGIQSPSELPPDLLQTYSHLSPQNMESVRAQFVHNIKAASGEYTPSDPKLFNSLQSRMYLPSGDPNKITDPSQITPYIAHGLNYTDSQRLVTQMRQANSPDSNPFLRQVNQVKSTARKMILSSNAALSHPELAEEAAYRFGLDIDQRVQEARKGGKDPSSLFVPSSPDYVLSPSRVGAFMPTESEIAASKAQKPGAGGMAYPTATNPKTGQKLVFKDGSWQAM